MPTSAPPELLAVDEPVEILPPGGGPFSAVYIANQSFFLLEVETDRTERPQLQSGNNAPYFALERSPGQITGVRVTARLYPGQTTPPPGASSAVSITWYGPREQPPGPGFSPVFSPAVDVTAVLPVGCIQLYGGTAAPAGWALCDGAELGRTAYADLFAIVGTTYGAGNGTTTFNLPDLRGRAPVGAGTGAGLTPRAPGSTFGAETVALSTANLASHSHAVTITDLGHDHGNSGGTHSHGVSDPGHFHAAPAAGGGFLFEDAAGDPMAFDVSGVLFSFGATAGAATGVTTQNGTAVITVASGVTGISAASGNTGSGTGHANMQPSLAVEFIIKTT